MSRPLKLILACTAVAGVAAIAAALQFNQFLDQPIRTNENSVVFEIPPGTSFRAIADDLGQRDIISKPFFFRLYGRMGNRASRIQAGEYEIEAGVTPRELVDKFVQGDVRLYSFTIVEGWTFRELIAAMNADPAIDSNLSDEDAPRILESLDAIAAHPEGLFLPETYRFPKGTPGTDVLRQAYELLHKTLQEEWDGRDTAAPLSSSYEALILASIVEKETALASERPRIAGVFARRLERRMRLQTDPTVIYGIGADFDGNLTRRDMRTDTPYNTYTRHGLPPTPIALPGRAAINAALHPAAGTEIYFVATGLGDGSHKFSDTKAQHDAAVQEYLARQRANRAQ
jgi:UPF0755 protein